MSELKIWLMAVIGISILVAGADGLIPAGGVKRAGQLVCGLVMVCILLQPLSRLRGVSITDWLEEYTRGLELEELRLEEETDTLRKEVIEDYFASYILDRCEAVERVEVDCGPGSEGLYLPVRIRLWGRYSDVERSGLTQWLEQELNIPAGEQTYYLTEEEAR